MSATCPVCHGSGESGQYGMLDCQAPACAAATDRAALEAHLQAHQKEFGRLHERDLIWEAYKLGQAKAAHQWISVAERLPEKYEHVITFGAKRLQWAVMTWVGSDGWEVESCSEIHSAYEPTHWMPLPAAPY